MPDRPRITAALGNAGAERIRGMRVGELSRDELVEMLEHVARRERQAGIDHYAPSEPIAGQPRVGLAACQVG